MILSSAASWKPTPAGSWHSSRKDGVNCVQAAAKPRAIGKGHGELRLSRLHPLLGQDTPWILGHQAQDGWETAAPVYASNLDMVSGEPPCATASAVSDVMSETAWLLPILWYPWQFQDARSGLRAYRAGLALLAEQTQPQGPHTLAEVCGVRPSQTAVTETQDHAQHLAGPGTAK